MPHHDLVIIGSGSGNSLITPELEHLDIAIVDDGIFGGTCLNVGCIPTKMFVLPADRVTEAAEAARLGVTFADPNVHWSAIRDRVFGRIDPISSGGLDYRLSQPGTTVYQSTGRFVGDRTLALSTGEQLTADRIVIATGSRAAGLPIDGLDTADPARDVHTSDTVMRMDELPRRMVIVGGGFIAAEFAHVFSAFGVDITLLQRSDVLLRHHQRDIAACFTEAMRARMDVRLSTQIESATRTGGSWAFELSGPEGRDTVEAEAVLLAVGRIPNGDRLDVTTGGVDLDDDGFVVVDDQQRTTASGVWALGDVSSPMMLKHVANHEARVVAHNLGVDVGSIDNAPRTSDHRFVPHAVFGHPQIASFGPTAEELEASGADYVSAHQKYGDVAYGWALEDAEGFLSIHAERATGKILAAHCIGPQASTVIQPLVQAAAFGQTAEQVARGQYWIHPALPELVENALLQIV